MMNRRTVLMLAPTTVVIAGLLGVVGLGLATESREAQDSALTEGSAMSRYGPGSPRTIEEVEAEIARGRANGYTLPAGYGRVQGRAQASLRAGQDIPRLADTGGRESRGIVVTPPLDTIGDKRDVADFPIQSGVDEYFDGIVFRIIRFRDEDIAQRAFDFLNMSPSPGEFSTDEFFTWAEVQGRPAKVVDYHEPIHAWCEMSQVAWIEGNTMYSLNSYEGVVPVEELLRIAESVTFD